MNKLSGIIPAFYFIATLAFSAFAGLFDLTTDAIKDSASLLEKIKQSDNPLYSYFSAAPAPATRSDLVSVINKKVIPSTDFAYKATNLAETKTNKKFENLTDEKKDECMAQNRELLAGLFPNEIAPRSEKTIQQSFGFHVPQQSIDTALWLKAEVIDFFNEIIASERNLSDWNNIKPFFDDNVRDEDIKLFTEELRTFDRLKIPINNISLTRRNNSDKFDVMIKGREDRRSKQLFTLSAIPGKRWKILKVTNIGNDLLKAGYITKKEVRK